MSDRLGPFLPPDGATNVCGPFDDRPTGLWSPRSTPTMNPRVFLGCFLLVSGVAPVIDFVPEGGR